MCIYTWIQRKQDNSKTIFYDKGKIYDFLIGNDKI